MLVLSRHIGERIIIDNHIVLEVLDIRGNRISLGIQAPPGSHILRGELVLHEANEAIQELPISDFVNTH